MFDHFKNRFGSFRPTDPVAAQASRLFEQHSAELLSQARAFVQEQLNNPDPSPTSSGEVRNDTGEQKGGQEERQPDYTDFVRWRRNQVARQLVADVQFQDWQADVLRTQAARQLPEHLQPLRDTKLTGRPARRVVDQDDILLSEMVERHLDSSDTDSHYRASSGTDTKFTN